MIKYVHAFSRHDADKFVRGQHADCAKIVRDFDNRIAWIGCTESPNDRSPIEIHHGPISVHAFKDVNPDAYVGSGIIFELPMTEMQAQSMVAFVERFARAEHPWAVLVHCRRASPARAPSPSGSRSATAPCAATSSRRCTGTAPPTATCGACSKRQAARLP